MSVRLFPPSIDARGPAEGGFSLVELMVTVSIVAILAALAVPSYNRIKQRFYDATALSDVVNAGKALAGTDSKTSFSQTVRGPGAIKALPGPYVSRGTTLLVQRTVAKNGSVTFLARASHQKGTGATYFVDDKGRVYATGAKLP